MAKSTARQTKKGSKASAARNGRKTGKPTAAPVVDDGSDKFDPVAAQAEYEKRKKSQLVSIKNTDQDVVLQQKV